jgi:hypothetical protein
MSPSTLHRSGNAFLVLVSAALLLLSFSTYADNDMLSYDDYLLDEQEKNQRMLNAMWLEEGMDENASRPENREALHQLTKGMVKKTWAALVKRDKSFDTFTPIVDGHFVSSSGGASYDVKLTSSVFKVSFDYSF